MKQSEARINDSHARFNILDARFNALHTALQILTRPSTRSITRFNLP